MNFSLTPIGTIKTCFKEKFGVPRQSLMADAAKGVVKLSEDPRLIPALNHLETFSHIWIIFLFHKTGDRNWRPNIDPPRLEADKQMGVFATRSPHRPNPIGMSVVKLEGIDLKADGGAELHVSGVDILDGTPLLDIKPYLPYADSVNSATSGWIKSEIESFPVSFSPQSLRLLQDLPQAAYPQLQELLEQMLRWDPRPTSQRRAVPMGDPKSEGAKFAFRVLDFDVHWEIRQGAPFVMRIEMLVS